MYKIGTFEQISDSIIISDPSYEYDVAEHEVGTTLMSLNNVISNTRKGLWNAYITRNLLSPDRNISLVAIHESIPTYPLLEYNWREIDSIGVDTGQAGIYDLLFYRDDHSVKGDPYASYIDIEDEDDYWYAVNSYISGKGLRAGVIPHGAISSSGYGDGIYPVSIMYDHQQVVGVWIDFSE